MHTFYHFGNISMNRRSLLRKLMLTPPATGLPGLAPRAAAADSPAAQAAEPMATGPFEPNWPSLTKYQTPTGTRG
jgi:alpha-L-fucosidase